MAINTIVLNSHNLAQCSSFTGKLAYLGGGVVLTDGTLRRDLVATTGKLRWTLTWTALSSSQLSDIIHAFGDAVAGDVGFTSPDGTGYTVNAGESPNMTWEAYKVYGGALRYRATMDLWQV